VPVPTASSHTIELADLHPGQWRVRDAARRFNVINCGRRWGKSTLGIDLALDSALDGLKVAYYEPSYPMLTEVWRELVRRLPPPIGKPSTQEHRIDIANGGVIDLWSLESRDSSRGRAYHRVIVDEAAKVPELLDVWQHVIRPTLSDFSGDAWFLSTPRGFNDFETLYGMGQDEDRTDWVAHTAPTSDNPHIAPAEIASARRDLDPRVFGQEYLADFLSDANAVFTEGLDTQSWLTRLPTPDLIPHATWVYRYPDHRSTYLMGVDVAEGLEHGDRSCAIVLERDTLGRCIEAAHLCGTYPTDTWAEYVDQLACAYGGLLGVERNNHGHAVLDHLRRFAAGRRHTPYRLYQEQAPLRSPTAGGIATHTGGWGWATTPASKPLLIDELEEALRTGQFLYGSERLRRQLRAYQRDEKGRTSAPSGKHDDCIMSGGIAFQMRKWAGVTAGYSRLKAVNMNLTGRR
jgi:hypothetical protein